MSVLSDALAALRLDLDRWLNTTRYSRTLAYGLRSDGNAQPLLVGPNGELLTNASGESGGGTVGGRTDAIGSDKIRPGVLIVTTAEDVHAGNEIPYYEHENNLPILSRVVLQPRGGDVWIGRASADDVNDQEGQPGRLLIPKNTLYEMDREEALQWCARAVSTNVILTYRVRYDGTPYSGD